MNVPENLKYTSDHEWLLDEGKSFSVGVSSYAVEQLGDIVYVELPEVGTEFAKGDAFGTIESTKTVSDIYIPLAGKITAINEELVNNPEKLQEDSYKGWLIKFTSTDKSAMSELLEAKAYKELIANH